MTWTKSVYKQLFHHMLDFFRPTHTHLLPEQSQYVFFHFRNISAPIHTALKGGVLRLAQEGFEPEAQTYVYSIEAQWLASRHANYINFIFTFTATTTAAFPDRYHVVASSFGKCVLGGLQPILQACIRPECKAMEKYLTGFRTGSVVEQGEKRPAGTLGRLTEKGFTCFVAIPLLRCGNFELAV